MKHQEIRKELQAIYDEWYKLDGNNKPRAKETAYYMTEIMLRELKNPASVNSITSLARSWESVDGQMRVIDRRDPVEWCIGLMYQISQLSKYSDRSAVCSYLQRDKLKLEVLSIMLRRAHTPRIIMMTYGDLKIWDMHALMVAEVLEPADTITVYNTLAKNKDKSDRTLLVLCELPEAKAEMTMEPVEENKKEEEQTPPRRQAIDFDEDIPQKVKEPKDPRRRGPYMTPYPDLFRRRF